MRILPLLLGTLLALAMPAASLDVPAPDWVVARAIVPRDAGDYELFASLGVAAPPDGIVLGRAFDDGRGRYVDVQTDAHEVTAVTVGAMAASTTFIVDPDGTAVASTGLHVVGTVHEGDEIRFLIFVPGSRILETRMTIRVGGEDVDETLSFGFGAQAVRITDGVGVGITRAHGPTAGAGAAVRELTVGEPVLGALAAHECRGCASAWTAPDGRTGRWLDAALVGTGTPSFEGPAGTWGFEHAGFATGQAVAALAPLAAME